MDESTLYKLTSCLVHTVFFGARVVLFFFGRVDWTFHAMMFVAVAGSKPEDSEDIHPKRGLTSMNSKVNIMFFPSEIAK